MAFHVEAARFASLVLLIDDNGFNSILRNGRSLYIEEDVIGAVVDLSSKKMDGTSVSSSEELIKGNPNDNEMPKQPVTQYPRSSQSKT
ncbi:unnamed protein product [Dovyalis caffra]|uniref:Uncharacterized protein n=1 Tax=Dovyalis caffra TaxID=77055 RepID=A0AAV1RUW7_9ROSI|nr:unnamed protein product [Dovyalis caffra]